MYRNGGGWEGDVEYYPLITSYFHLGEELVYESRGTGLRSLPYVALFPHGVLFALFGIGGLVLADALVKLLYYGSLSGLMKTLGLGAYAAESISAFVVANGWYAVGVVTNAAFGKPWLLFLADMRIPRPFVTDVILFVTLAFLLRPCLEKIDKINSTSWLLFGVLLGLLMQSDIFSFLILGPALIAQSGYLGWRALRRTDLWARIWANWGLCAAAFILISVPFIVQRASEHPDIPVRLGVFPVPRTSPLVSPEGLSYVGVATAMVLATLLIVAVCSPRQQELRVRSILALWVVDVLSVLGLPVSCMALGKSLQTIHFGFGVHAISSLVMVLCCAQVAESIATLLRRRFAPRAAGRQLVRCARRGGEVLLCATCAFYTSALAWQHADASGLPGFIPLATELSRHKLDNWKVMGTPDDEVSYWWTSFGGGCAYLPDCLFTTVPDRALEERFVSFCREIGMNRKDFQAELSEHETKARWLGGLKFQASRDYLPAPLEDYSAEDRAWILQHRSYDSWWRLVIPQTTEARLVRMFDAAKPASETARRLDVIVLKRDKVTRSLAPSADRYRLVYEDETYRVWERRARSAETP